jgi:hypothetical protein
MRAAKIAASVLALLLVVVFSTVEISGATTPMPIRMWLMTSIAVTTFGAFALCIIERQIQIVKKLSDLFEMISELVDEKRANQKFDDLKQRFNRAPEGRDNIRALFTEE